MTETPPHTATTSRDNTQGVNKADTDKTKIYTEIINSKQIIISNLSVRVCLLKISQSSTNSICRSNTTGDGIIFWKNLHIIII